MERITKYFSHDYESDTAIEYVNTGMYSMLNCSYTSEDPDCGTDTLHYNADSVKPFEQLAYEMAKEIETYLDATEDGTHRKSNAPYARSYEEYFTSTLYAIEKALKDISKNYRPDALGERIGEMLDKIHEEFNVETYRYRQGDKIVIEARDRRA